MRIENLFFVMILLIPAANAIKVTPYIDAGELQYNKSYGYSLYIENDENTAKSITMKITPRASYLLPYVSITPKTFLLGKNSARNVIIELSTYMNMPGEHQLTIMPEISDTGGGINIVSTFVTTIRFSLPGNVTRSLTAESLDIAINKDTAIMAIKVKNNGNVRVSAFPAIEVWRQNSFLARAEGNTEYLIDAGATKTMELKYAASSNDKYRAIAFVRYDGYLSNKIEKEFEITSLTESNGGAGSTGNTGSSSSGASSHGNAGNSSSLNNPVPTINISGDSAVKNKGQLKILKFIIDSIKLGEPFVMLLSLENTESDNVNYEYMFEITQNGILLYTQTGSDKINGFETKELRHTWLGKPGNYTVRAAVLYNGQLLEESVSTNVLSEESITPTGLVVGDQNSVLIAAVILILMPIAFIIIQKKRKG